MYLFLIIYSAIGMASDVGGKTVLRKLGEAPPASSWKQVREPDSGSLKLKNIKKGTPNFSEEGNNLSSEIIRGQSVAVDEPKKVVFISKFGSNPTTINIGDIFDCLIPQDILGYVGSVSPIRAEITEGEYKGYAFIGNATMDQKTKSIVIEFHKLISKHKTDVFDVKATVHSVTGELGLVGTYNSHYWSYFFAAVLARGAQGYAEGIVQRDRNILGQYINVPNNDNSGRIAVAQAGQQTAELMAEQMKQAPEFTTAKGPILTKIFVMEAPKLNLRR